MQLQTFTDVQQFNENLQNTESTDEDQLIDPQHYEHRLITDTGYQKRTSIPITYDSAATSALLAPKQKTGLGRKGTERRYTKVGKRDYSDLPLTVIGAADQQKVK